jgi:hypothetical protein
MKALRRLLSLALAALLALVSSACAEIAECPQVETDVREITKFGNLVLTITSKSFLSLGYEVGDIISVNIGDTSLDVPICTDYDDADVGAPLCRVAEETKPDGKNVLLAINNGDLATWLGVATRTTIDEDPGYRWVYAEAYAGGVPVTLSLVEKGGYLEQIKLHRLQMSNNRADYPDLTDAQYANFRNIATTGMGANVLYRSSSPINPKYNRSREADNAVNAAGIRTVLNLSDNQAVMESYEDYAQSYYSRLDVLPLDMIVLFESEVLRDGVCRGLRFLAGHEGPYLVHCSIGKDRTGFICALLECLMGATADEVVADYMVTYYNFFGIEPGSDAYEIIANSNIRKILGDIFHVENLSDADLSACAEACLLDLGLTADEIAAVRRCLGTDIL